MQNICFKCKILFFTLIIQLFNDAIINVIKCISLRFIVLFILIQQNAKG
jgi:hypothetical protein